eukprot:TRINITY_DN3435_c0_g2_i1.p1 TRINITY_DN3435_c0_g2~~TRINITY_DN3435_c0_g2_i1.p1  ORF type:complete len:708 (+),score=103.01 TRINITY_DN3435_c0_g2_i1:27-2126(+)
MKIHPCVWLVIISLPPTIYLFSQLTPAASPQRPGARIVRHKSAVDSPQGAEPLPEKAAVIPEPVPEPLPEPEPAAHQEVHTKPSVVQPQKQSHKLATYRDVTFWVTGHVTPTKDYATNLVTPPHTPFTESIFVSLPPPLASKGNRTLGHYKKAILFCEFWTVTFVAWLTECLPRYIALRDAGFTPSPDTPLLIPGESFVLQYLVEVMLLSDQDVVVLPSHLVWNLRYPNYYLEFDELVHVPRPNYGPIEALQRVRQELVPRLPRPFRSVVLFSERLDMSMPANFTGFLEQLQFHSPVPVESVRFETLRVVDQLAKLRNTAALVGPPGLNLLNMIFLPDDSPVVELFGDTVDTNYTIRKPTEWTFVKDLARAIGLKYVRLYPQIPAQRQKQAVFDPAAAMASLKSLLAGSAPAFPVQRVARLSPPMLDCENMYHKSKYFHLKGLYKETYLVPNQFALKISRGGDWKPLLKEMRVLRNFSEPIITPALAMCFAEGMFAQALIRQLGPHGATKATRWSSHEDYFLTLAGFMQFWDANRVRGSYLFYCDPGPKNLGLSKDSGPMRLQMFDFDVSALIAPGALCSDDVDCGCEPSYPSACQNNRCTREGLQSKVDAITHGAISTLVRQYSPPELFKSDPRTKRMIELLTTPEPVSCEDIVDYIEAGLGKQNAKAGKFLPPCHKRTLAVSVQHEGRRARKKAAKE